jgi:hypothetical protein
MFSEYQLARIVGIACWYCFGVEISTMTLRKWRLPTQYCRFDSELCYRFVIAGSEATKQSGGTVEAGDWHTPFRRSQ